jgi:hypothetical protein
MIPHSHITIAIVQVCTFVALVFSVCEPAMACDREDIQKRRNQQLRVKTD